MINQFPDSFDSHDAGRKCYGHIKSKSQATPINN